MIFAVKTTLFAEEERAPYRIPGVPEKPIMYWPDPIIHRGEGRTAPPAPAQTPEEKAKGAIVFNPYASVPDMRGGGTSGLEGFGVGEDAITELAKHQSRMFWLSIISTLSIATVASIGLYRLLRGDRG